MTHAAGIAGIVLAAGESSRMGRDKALLPWPPHETATGPASETFLSAAIRSLSLATDYVVVVAGKNQAVLAPVVYGCGASLACNPDPSRGQFSSLQVGLHDVLNHGRDCAMVTLVDRPPAEAATLQILRRAFEAADPSVWAIVPEFSGRHGHPYVVGRELIEVFLRAPAQASARDLEHQHHIHMQYVPVDDPRVVSNINTPEDYAALDPQGRI